MASTTQLWDTTADWDAGSFSQTKSDSGSVILQKDTSPSTTQNESFTVSLSLNNLEDVDIYWEIRDVDAGTTVASGGTSTADAGQTWTPTIDIHAHHNLEFYSVWNSATAVGTTGPYEGEITVTDFNSTQVHRNYYDDSTHSTPKSKTTSEAYPEELPTYASGSHTTELRDYGSDVVVNQLVATTTYNSGDGDSVDLVVKTQAGDSSTTISAASGESRYAVNLPRDDQYQIKGTLNHGALETTSPSLDRYELVARGTPQTVQVTGRRDTELDLAWQQAPNHDGVEVYLAEASGSTTADYTLDHTTAAGATSTTITDLENGEKYYIRLRATYPSGVSDLSTEVTGTTTVPAPSLDDLVVRADDITVHYTPQDNSSDGDILIERSTDGGSSWTTAATITDLSATEYTDGELADETTHDYRVTRRTDHATATSGTLSAATVPFTALVISQTQVDIYWEDPDSYSQTGFRVYREREYDAGWGPQEQIADVGGSTTMLVDDALLPGERYRWTIEPYTSSSTGATISGTATTTAPSEPTSRVPASDWHVEIDHTSGATLTPDVVGTPKRNPVVRGLPELRIPVPKSEKWNATGFEDADVRVWEDGQRQPVDQLVNVKQQPKTTLLVARGGIQLEDRVTTDVVEEKAHVTARDLVSNNTSYATNVDAPATTAEEDVLVQSADTQSELESNLQSAIAATDPARVTSTGRVKVTSTLQFVESEDMTHGAGSATYESSSDRWIGGHVQEFDVTGVNQYSEASRTTQHEIPASDVGVAFRLQQPGDGHHGFKIQLDVGATGSWTTITTVAPDTLTTGDTEPSWFEAVGIGSSLAAGTHKIRILFNGEGTSSGSDPRTYVDAGGLYDARYYTGLTSTVTDNVADGPATHAATYTVEFVDATPTKSVVGGHAVLTINDTSGSQALGLSNDSGATWTTTSNASEIRTDWQSATDSIRLRVTLGPYTADSTTTPSQDDAGQSLDAYTLDADLLDTPILVNKSYDGQLKEILSEIADYANAVWTVRWTDGGYQFEWTWPGQRPTSLDVEDVLNYTLEKNRGVRVEKAVVYGSHRGVTGESVTANHGTEVSLAHAPVVEGSETVQSASDGTTYDWGSDYVLRNQAGTIETLSTGAITDGESLTVDYQYKIQNSYTASGVSSPRERRFDFPGIPTTRGCGQAALHLVQQLQDPVISAELVVPKAPLGWNVMNAIQPSVLDVDQDLQIRDLRQSPEQAVITLASRRSASDIVQDLRDRVATLEKRS